MTENTIAVSKNVALALAEVIRSDAEKAELLVFLDRVVNGHFGPMTAPNDTVVYDLGIKACSNDDCSQPGTAYWGEHAMCDSCLYA